MNAREWSDQDTNLPLGEMFAIAGTTNTMWSDLLKQF